ncbi:MAG: hypothetical protein ACK4S3_06470 [Parvibaculum sp.]
MASDPTDVLDRPGFAAFFDTHASSSFIAETLGSVGSHVEFKDDTDPEWDSEWEKAGARNRGSIGRAERMADALLDSAQALFEIIRDYKRQAIDSAIAKIEASDLSDPVARKQALAEIVRLNKMRDQLDKTFRRDFPQLRVREP